VDTFKVLSKIQGIECVLYGHASPEDLDALEADLNGGMIIHALYTEFPGNPLMTSPDLESLRQLSLKYDFPLVIDDTIATSINVALFPYCDVICTSLTKMFSGGCNVMGGSAVLNPHSPWYVRMRRTISTQPSEPYFPLDVLIMEQNSKDFRQRIMQANTNAEMIVDLLKCHTSVAQVFYPKGSPSQRLYDRFRRSGGGYGFLVSIRFVTAATAIAFYDALDVAKGPSLGTNFTLCCAYTLLAHYRELEWAAKFGVTEHLIRISVGIERPEVLEELVAKALAAAAETLTVGRDDSEMDISE
jgi:cystathionine gamma-synthase